MSPYEFLLHSLSNTLQMPKIDASHETTSWYRFTENSLLSTVDTNVENIKEQAVDSGATSHFLVTATPKSNVQPAINPLVVKLPDRENIRSTATCILAIPQLLAKVKEGHGIPGLAYPSLLSNVRLCNARYEVKFAKIDCTMVAYRGIIVLKRHKCIKTGLWVVPLSENIC